MKLFYNCLLICVLYGSAFTSSGQNLVITYKNSDALFVCGSDTFFVAVLNVGPSAVSSATLLVDLPTGLMYVPGTITGGSQQNISNLQHPVFNLPTLAPGASVNLSLSLTADCAAANALDLGALFIANLTVNAPGSTTQVSTGSIPLETGLLLIESVDSPLMTGERGDTLYRKICLKNTRLGPIGILHFEDAHLPGIDISVAGSTTLTNDSTLFAANFDGNLFAAVGDGDAFLELGEIVCLTERIIITDCGIPEFTNPSMLRAGWGCGDAICRMDSLLVGLEIKKSTKVPDLVFANIWTPPLDHCGDVGSAIGLKINNIGKGNAENVFIHIKVAERTLAAMGPGSFRVAHQNDTINLPLTAFIPDSLHACGKILTDDATLVIPFIAALDSLTLLFESYTCVTPCNQVLPTFFVEYFYRKPCPVNGFVSDTLIIAPDPEFALGSEFRTNIGNCLQLGQTYPFSYILQSKRLVQPYGFLRLQFILPHGLEWSDSCSTLLAGQSPVSFSLAPNADQLTTVSITYALPLPEDSVTMGFCLKFVCDTAIECLNGTAPLDGVVYASDCGEPCLVKLDYKAFWLLQQNTALDCGISACGEQMLGLSQNNSCFPDTSNGGGGTVNVDPGQVTGALYSWCFNVYRTNFGLPDIDDNRTADGPGVANSAGVRRDRFLPGDTMRVEYCGSVDTGGGIFFIPRTIYHEVVRSDMGTGGNDAFLTPGAKTIITNADNFRFIKDSIRVHYANGTVFSCPLDGYTSVVDEKFYSVQQLNTSPPTVIDELATQHHYFSVNLDTLFAYGCLPKPTLDAGDSIFFYTDFKLDFNYRPSSSNLPDPPLIGLRTAYTHLGGKFAWNNYPLKKQQYSGFKTSRSNNTFSIKPCENSIEAKSFRYRLHIARENMFPFEVRPLARIIDYFQTTPTALNVASVKLQYLVLQDSTPKLLNLPLNYTLQNGKLDVDFTPVFADPVDEGFSLATKIVFDPACEFAQPDSSRQFLSVAFPPCVNHPDTLLDSLYNPIGFFSNRPLLKIESADTTVYITQQEFDIDFVLKNLVISPAPNLWLSVVSPSGQAHNFDLLQMPQQQAINDINGIYQLTNLSGFNQKSYRLTGKNNACEGDSILLIFGWGCDQLTNLGQDACGRDTFVIHLLQKRPELELEILQQPAAINLCEISDYFEFEVYNAKTGYAYDLFASTSLPSGLSIVPGSCEISYPAGSAYVPIPDPQLLPGNFYQWNINALQAAIATNGLPGNDAAPGNAFRIRFKTLAECGFVSNTQPIFGVNGTEPCGRSTNVLNKPGNPISISGLNPTYGVLVSLQPEGVVNNFCGGTQTFRVKLTLLGQPSAGDSIYVTLPQAVTFVPGSYQPVTNAPGGQPVLDMNGFRVALPANGTNGSILEFLFTAEYGTGAGCSDQFIRVQTRVRTEAFCQSLGAPCTVYVATGETALNLNLIHAELSVINTNTILSGNQVSTSITFNNIGTIPVTGLVAQIYQDVDGNNILSPADILLQTISDNASLTPGSSFVLTADLNIPANLLCDLLVVIPAAENCACADQVFPMEGFTQVHDTQVFCEVQAVPVGIPPQPGFIYQWQTPNGIACTTCSNTSYQPPAGTQPGTSQDLVLVEQSDDCTIVHHFEVVFGTAISITSNNSTICAGDAATLTVKPDGALYTWQGLGIQIPGNQQQVVTPAQSTTYTVLITLPNGCTADTSIAIAVLPSDTVQLPGLITCQGEAVQVLDQFTDIAGVYAKLYPKSNGCDSLVLQALSVLPSPSTTEALTFCLGDTIQVLDTLLTQGGQVCRQYQAINGCDSVHCVNVKAFIPPMIPDPDTIYGQVLTPIILTANNGYVSYTWDPADPACPNCTTITPVFGSAGYYEYILTVKDENGCEGSVIYRLLVLPPCNGDSLRIPNVFTPNGDGVNDVFKVVPYEGAEVIGSMTIYDRWGEKVYENTGNVFWDGTIDGKPAPSDVYVYIIEILCGDTVDKRIDEVTLLR